MFLAATLRFAYRPLWETLDVQNREYTLYSIMSVTYCAYNVSVTFSRYPLKVVVEGVYNVKLYPEEGETTTILNMKRGIISALLVPLVEEDKNNYMVRLPHEKKRCRKNIP